MQKKALSVIGVAVLIMGAGVFLSTLWQEKLADMPVARLPARSPMFLDRRMCIYVTGDEVVGWRIQATPPWVVSACARDFTKTLIDLGDGFAEWTGGWPLYSTIFLDKLEYRVTSVYTERGVRMYGLERAFKADYVDQKATSSVDLSRYKDQDWSNVPWQKRKNP